MNWLTYHTSVLLLFFGTTLAAPIEQPLQSPLATTRLEEQLDAIDQELKSLAQPRLLSGIGPIGYRSQSHDTDGHKEWIEVTLQDETTPLHSLNHLLMMLITDFFDFPPRTHLVCRFISWTAGLSKRHQQEPSQWFTYSPSQYLAHTRYSFWKIRRPVMK